MNKLRRVNRWPLIYTYSLGDVVYVCSPGLKYVGLGEIVRTNGDGTENFGSAAHRVRLFSIPHYSAVIVYNREISMAWLEAEACFK